MCSVPPQPLMAVPPGGADGVGLGAAGEASGEVDGLGVVGGTGDDRGVLDGGGVADALGNGVAVGSGVGGGVPGLLVSTTAVGIATAISRARNHEGFTSAAWRARRRR